MNFGQALNLMRDNERKVRRSVWNHEPMYLEFKDSAIIQSGIDDWIPIQVDILADDWEIVE